MLRPATRSALILVVSVVAPLLATGCFEGREYDLDQGNTETTEPEPGCLPSECDGTCCGDACVEDFNTNSAHCGECDNTCAYYERCEAGICECTPSCDDKVCGSDSCGGSCGDCPSGEVCSWREDSAACIAENVGCSDGSREGFVDTSLFPEIASCAAHWPVQGLRGPASGIACGNDLEDDCRGPRDACADGWHFCAYNGFPEDVRGRATGDDCASAAAGEGIFVIASDYDDGTGTCDDAPFECSDERSAMCCGTGCELAVLSCVWPEVPGLVTGTPCKSVSDANGVVCCRDPSVEG